MPGDKELAKQGVQVEVDALGQCCAQQRGLQALEQASPARLLDNLILQAACAIC